MKKRFDSEKLDFSTCVPSCSEFDLHSALLDKLRSMQALLASPLTFTSGFRPKSWELSKGRDGSSSHSKTPGLAVDISTLNSHWRYKVLAAAICVGFERIGVGKNFIHVDIDDSKAHPIVFHYYE